MLTSRGACPYEPEGGKEGWAGANSTPGADKLLSFSMCLEELGGSEEMCIFTS